MEAEVETTAKVHAHCMFWTHTTCTYVDVNYSQTLF